MESRINKLPRSCVRVEEDFHHMSGKNGTNDDRLKIEKQSWPNRSVFNAHDPDTLPLNSTLTLTCEDTDIEELKECLFKDPFESRHKFFAIRRGGRAGYPTNKDIFAANMNMSRVNILTITPI